MGLLDDLENKVVSRVMSGTINPLASQLLQMIQQQPGGLSGLVQNFHNIRIGRSRHFVGRNRTEHANFR
jgi:hypothetical protein